MTHPRRVTRAFDRASEAADLVGQRSRWSKPWFNAVHAYLSWVQKGRAYYFDDRAKNPAYLDPMPEFPDIRAEIPNGLLHYCAGMIEDRRIAAWFRK